MSDNIPLDDLEIYQIAMNIGEAIWSLVDKWNSFAETTIGGQITRAADSMAANIAEGYGRYFTKTGSNFIIKAEARFWKQKHGSKNLVTDN